MAREWERSSFSSAWESFSRMTRSPLYGLGALGVSGFVIGWLLSLFPEDRCSWICNGGVGAGVGTLLFITLFGIVWFRAPYGQRDAAKRHIDNLERKPSVVIEDAIQEDSGWYLPIRNNGPGDVELYAGLISMEYEDGSGKHTRKNPIEYLLWEGGTGHHPDTPNWRTVRDGQIWRLHICLVTGSATLNGETGTSVRVPAAHSSNNIEAGFVIGSDLVMTVQVFGRPTPAERVTHTITLEVPSPL